MMQQIILSPRCPHGWSWGQQQDVGEAQQCAALNHLGTCPWEWHLKPMTRDEFIEALRRAKTRVAELPEDRRRQLQQSIDEASERARFQAEYRRPE